MSTSELEEFGTIPDPLDAHSGALRMPTKQGKSTNHSDALLSTTNAQNPENERRSAGAPTLPNERSPTRNEASRNRRLALASSIAWLVVAEIIVHPRPDVLNTTVLSQIAVWSLMLPLGLALALRPKQNGFPLSANLVRGGLALIAIVFCGLALVPVQGTTTAFSLASTAGCLALTAIFAAPAMLFATLVLRNRFLNSAGLRGAMVGAVCGLAGSLGAHTHCPIVNVSHVLSAHGPAIVVFAAIGALVGTTRGRA